MFEKNAVSKGLFYLFTMVLGVVCTKFFIKKQFSLAIYVIMIYSIYFLIIYFEKRNQYTLPAMIKALAMIVLMVDIVGGFYFNLYHTSNWFDKAMHLFGGFAGTLLLFCILYPHIKNISDSKIVAFIIITSLGVAFGVFYEFSEFALDKIMKSKTQNGLMDTNLDLICDTVGAMAAAGLILYRSILQFSDKK